MTRTRIINCIMLAFHLIGIFLAILFWYIIDDPGFYPTEFVIIGLSFHIIFLLFTIYLTIIDMTIFEYVFGGLTWNEWTRRLAVSLRLTPTSISRRFIRTRNKKFKERGKMRRGYTELL